MDRPKLRNLERIRHVRGGERLLVIRDPLGVADPFVLDSEFARVLDLLDGTRSLDQVRQSLRLMSGVTLEPRDLEQFVEDLARSGCLDDHQFREMWADIHAAFLDLPDRPPRLSGNLYPSDPAELIEVLARALPSRDRCRRGTDVIGVVVPHGPPSLVADIVDETLIDLPPADELDLVLMLGTDHGVGRLPYCATTKHYRLPTATVHTDQDSVRELEDRVPWILREQIRHRNALSLEFGALWLWAVYREGCPPILPILCGHSALRESPEVDELIAALELVCGQRRTLIWTCAELAHAGPAYGRPELDEAARERVEGQDQAIIVSLVKGDLGRLERLCAEDVPHGPPSGGAALVSHQRLLPINTRGDRAAYSLKPVPAPEPGWAGLAGIRFRRSVDCG